MENEQLKKRIKELFLKSTPRKEKEYWKPVRCLSIKEEEVSLRYVFFGHSEGYHLEYWWMNHVFYPKYAVFESKDKLDLLVVKAIYDESDDSFYFAPLLDEDIDNIIQLLNGYKEKTISFHLIPHSNYKITKLNERITLAMSVRREDDGAFIIHWCN